MWLHCGVKAANKCGYSGEFCILDITKGGKLILGYTESVLLKKDTRHIRYITESCHVRFKDILCVTCNKICKANLSFLC